MVNVVGSHQFAISEWNQLRGWARDKKDAIMWCKWASVGEQCKHSSRAPLAAGPWVSEVTTFGSQIFSRGVSPLHFRTFVFSLSPSLSFSLRLFSPVFLCDLQSTSILSSPYLRYKINQTCRTSRIQLLSHWREYHQLVFSLIKLLHEIADFPFCLALSGFQISAG